MGPGLDAQFEDSIHHDAVSDLVQDARYVNVSGNDLAYFPHCNYAGNPPLDEDACHSSAQSKPSKEVSD